FGLFSTVFKPTFAAIVCGGAALGSDWLLERLMGGGKIATALCIIIAAVVYIICLGVSKTFTENDILMLPKGEKLAKVLAKLHWIG
ncbi:MAG: polysaccharide biosynthesis protein, partial [Clostridia bacterium]|nr:polysaccharide biosynthesis protein [Clostridia bacterium]